MCFPPRFRPFFEVVNVHEIKIFVTEDTKLNRSHSYKKLFSRDLTAIYAGAFQVGSKGHHWTSHASMRKENLSDTAIEIFIIFQIDDPLLL